MIEKKDNLYFFLQSIRKGVTLKTRRKIRGLIFIFLLVFGVQLFHGQNVKTVFIPENIDIEENTAQETIVRDLQEQDIFRAGFIFCVGEFLYFFNSKPSEIVKLSLQGNVVKRIGKKGRGPGEYVNLFSLWPYKENLAILDGVGRKVLFYTKDLEFRDEFRLTKQFLGLFVNKNNECVLYNNYNASNYFWVYTNSGKFLRKFGKPLQERKSGDQIKIIEFDEAGFIQYIPGKDGFWVAFRNRYDLRYYEREKLTGEIRAKKGYFKWEEKEEMMNLKRKRYIDCPKYLAGNGNRLFYFFKKDDHIFCDIFNMGDYRLLRRVRCRMDYRVIAHYKDNIFYALAYDDNEERDLLLYKIEV